MWNRKAKERFWVCNELFRNNKSEAKGKIASKFRIVNNEIGIRVSDIDSGETLEDLQVIYCHEDMIVYLARRMVDSVYGVVAWSLSTDVKMRISELQNPDACIVKTDVADYLVIVSSSIISVYNCSTGEFVRCKEINNEIVSHQI